MQPIEDYLAEAIADRLAKDWGPQPPEEPVVPRRTEKNVAQAAAEAAVEALYRLWPDHFVIFTEDRWTIEHSMACRLSGDMELCSYHAAIEEVYDQAPDPEDLGKWRIVDIDSEGLPSLERDGGHSGE